jgi:hypothetical protein
MGRPAYSVFTCSCGERCVMVPHEKSGKLAPITEATYDNGNIAHFYTEGGRELDGRTWDQMPAVGSAVRSCRVCGCTEEDCSGCVERSGKPCHWVAADLSSACAGGATDGA